MATTATTNEAIPTTRYVGAIKGVLFLYAFCAVLIFVAIPTFFSFVGVPTLATSGVPIAVFQHPENLTGYCDNNIAAQACASLALVGERGCRASDAIVDWVSCRLTRHVRAMFESTAAGMHALLPKSVCCWTVPIVCSMHWMSLLFVAAGLFVAIPIIVIAPVVLCCAEIVRAIGRVTDKAHSQ